MGVTMGSFWGQPTARLTPSTRKNHLKVAKNAETLFEQRLLLPQRGSVQGGGSHPSAVCSTCAQAHLAQIHLAQDQLDQDLLTNSTKDEVDSSSSTTSSSSSSLSSSITSTISKKSKSKRTVTFMPLLPDDDHQAEVAEE